MPLAGLDTLDVSVERCPCGIDVISKRQPGHGLRVTHVRHSYACWLAQRDDAPSWRRA